MDRNWAAIRAQVHVAADLYERHFGQRPRGHVAGRVRLRPGRRRAAARGGGPLLLRRHPRAPLRRSPAASTASTRRSTARPASPPSRRDTESSEQVWSAKEGYPGDPHYRDFYRDIGFDLPLDYIGPYIHPERAPRSTPGFKYHAITHDQLHDKWVYDPDVARGRAGLHAAHFRGNREKQVEALAAADGSAADRRQPLRRRALRPLVVRGAALPERPVPPAPLRPETRSRRSRPATTWSATPPTRWRRPAPRRGGSRATTSTGCNETNAWIYRHLHVAAERMVGAGAPQSRAPTGLERARAQPGGARADAGAVERLGLHHDDRHDRPLRDAARQRAHPCASPGSTRI